LFFEEIVFEEIEIVFEEIVFLKSFVSK